MKSIIKANLLIITTISWLLLTLSLPHLYRFLQLGKNYTILFFDNPVANQTNWEETYTYATEANRIKNNQPINDTYIYEYRNKPSPLISELVPSVLLGVPAKVLSIPLVFILAKIFVLPTTILIWYLIARQIGYSKRTSFCAALSSLILQKLFVYIPYFPKIFTYELNGYLEAQRVYFPLISSFITSLTILFILKILDNKKMNYVLLSGILLGSLFYTYFFAWSLIWLSLILFLISLKIFKWQNQVKTLLIVLAVGFIIGLPYFINIFYFYQNPAHYDFLLRTISFRITDWNIPIIFRFLVFLLLIITFQREWFKSQSRKLIIAVYLTATLLPIVSMVILHANNQTDHWHERFLYPLSTFMLVLFISDTLNKFNLKIKKIVLLSLIIISFLKVGVVTLEEFQKPSVAFTISKGRIDLYSWMLKNLPKDSVIGSLSFTEQIYLTAYTPFYAYIPQSYKTIASSEEILQRYGNLVNIYGVNEFFLTQSFLMPGQSHSNPLSRVANDGSALAILLGNANHYDVFPYPLHKKAQDQMISLSKIKVPQQGKLDFLLFGPLEEENAINFTQRKCKLLYSNGIYNLYNFKTGPATILAP